MKLEIESKTDKELRFVLSDAPLEFANLLRRYAISSVQTFAITEAAFYENTSSFFDEYISHRLGLIPLTTPSKLKSDEEVTLMIDAEGPAVVYSGNMKSTDKAVKPVSDKIPIIKLSEGQRLRVEAKALPGTARTHAKYQPGIISYGYENEDTFRFVIESYGQMDAEDILARAISQIQSNAEDIEKLLEKHEA
jgi:DNA-directed RNA polymerase subunit D